MLIVCSGPDSYRALEKAKELEAAYREKYDKGALSIEHLSSGKEGVDEVLSLSAGASLFSNRRFIRCDGILSSCPKAKRTSLYKALSHDSEMTIVVSIESKLLTEKEIKECTEHIPKFIHYPFPALSPANFLKWAVSYASRYQFSDQKILRHLIDAVQGDSWRFVTEFQKILAGGNSSVELQTEQTVFQIIDSLLLQKEHRFTDIRSFDDYEQIAAQSISQARSFVLAKAGEVSGIHPYVAQKFSRLSVKNLPDVYRRSADIFIWSRSGRSSAEEAVDILA